MKKFIFVCGFLIFFFTFSRQVFASANVAEPSAQTQKVEEKSYDNRPLILKSFLEKNNSPLAENSSLIVNEADKNGVPWTWVVAISGVESTFGNAIPTNSYNGWGWANGNYSFKDWTDGVKTVTMSLRENYIDKGADTIDKIAPIYAPPSNTWAGKVKYFISEIENFAATDLSSLPISI